MSVSGALTESLPWHTSTRRIAPETLALLTIKECRVSSFIIKVHAEVYQFKL